MLATANKTGIAIKILLIKIASMRNQSLSR
jgi:hypothetical protein